MLSTLSCTTYTFPFCGLSPSGKDSRLLTCDVAHGAGEPQSHHVSVGALAVSSFQHFLRFFLVVFPSSGWNDKALNLRRCTRCRRAALQHFSLTAACQRSRCERAENNWSSSLHLPRTTCFLLWSSNSSGWNDKALNLRNIFPVRLGRKSSPPAGIVRFPLRATSVRRCTNKGDEIRECTTPVTDATKIRARIIKLTRNRPTSLPVLE